MHAPDLFSRVYVMNQRRFLLVRARRTFPSQMAFFYDDHGLDFDISLYENSINQSNVDLFDQTDQSVTFLRCC